MELHAVVLAGGKGERFWPLSRAHSPKQLLRLLGEETLLGATLERVAPRVKPERSWVILSAESRSSVERLKLSGRAGRWLWEPVGRNTAAAIGAAVELILAERDDAEVLVLPSDHWIPDAAAFWRTVDSGRAALGRGVPLVTFGIQPAYPETGYGYIERGAPLEGIPSAHQVALFHEKPDAARARQYVEGGRCYWNSGIFLFPAATMAELLRRHVVDLAAPLDRLRAEVRAAGVGARAFFSGSPEPTAWRRYFEEAPAISIDHGVMERAERVAVIEAAFAWSDLGNWTSLAEQLPSDRAGNRSRGDTLVLDSEACVLFSESGGLLAVLGVRDLIVVRVGDATLVCPKERAQEVRRCVHEGRLDDRLRRFF